MAAHSSAMPKAVPFRTLRGASTGMLLVVALAGAALMALPAVLADAERFWRALHFNWLFWASLSVGMGMFAVSLHLTNARWAWSVRRFALAGLGFLPLAILLFPLVYFGAASDEGGNIYHHWIHSSGDPIIEAKRAWLSVGGIFARDLVGLLVLGGLLLYFAYLHLRPDVYGAGRRNGADGLYARMTGGWRGIDAEAERSWGRANYVGVFAALGFALIWGMIAIDQAMAMLPHFFSTMFPVAFFVAAFHAGICATALAAVLLRRRMGIAEFVTPRQFHDLGKLVFAFAVFWMYINWSQYVVIWYGQLMHEQEFFILRFREPFTTLAKAVPLLIFALPFLGLLARPPKTVPAILGVFAALILVGNWIERFMITVPSVYEGETLPFGLAEVVMGLGFLGLFAATYGLFLRTFPVLPSPAMMRAAGQAEIEVEVPDAHPAGA